MPNLEKQKNYFKRLIKSDSLSHAYVFVGEDKFANLSFAKELCTLISGKNFDNNPDIKFIYPDIEKDIYKIHIENIRGLKYFMSFKPYSSNYKIAVINDADTITIEAANSLLKILEEPPSQSMIILISSKAKLLPQTILSRCEIVRFLTLQQEQTSESSKAGLNFDKIRKQNIASRMRYARNIYEKENYIELVNLWLNSLRPKLLEDNSLAPVLRNLLNLSKIISQPQFNHRIALENFFVTLY